MKVLKLKRLDLLKSMKKIGISLNKLIPISVPYQPTLILNIKTNALRQWQSMAVINRVSGAAHIAFPRI